MIWIRKITSGSFVPWLEGIENDCKVFIDFLFCTKGGNKYYFLVSHLKSDMSYSSPKDGKFYATEDECKVAAVEFLEKVNYWK